MKNLLARLPGLKFAAGILGGALIALVYPDPFRRWGDYELKALVVPFVQFAMFGMGTRVSLRDLGRVIVSPGPIAFGLAVQYTVMPALAVLLVNLFGFTGEIGAGVILLGSACAGASSNLMTFLAGGNLALSVTMTTLSTLVSPVLTPGLMKLLAGRMVEVKFAAMMWSIVKIVLVPISAGIAIQQILGTRRQWMDRILPSLSIVSICCANTILVASSRDVILASGLMMLAAEILHNFGGYTAGFWLARAAGFCRKDAITMAMQVGIRNGGMSSGLAVDVLKSTNAAIASAVFGTVQNASGAVLASVLNPAASATPKEKT